MRVVLVPELSPGNGTGHLRRCMRLLAAIPDSVILARDPDARFRALLETIDSNRLVSTIPDSCETIVVDRFCIDREEALSLTKRAMTFGVDCGGEGRPYFDYLVDSLPGPENAEPNVAGPRFLDLPRAEETGLAARRGVLITFGGEDPACLSETVTDLLATVLAGSSGGPSLTLVKPAARELGAVPDTVEVTQPVSDLAPMLRAADLVVTSYGLTAFEAVAAGARVVTVNPTEYHKKLARRAGFLSVRATPGGVRTLHSAAIGDTRVPTPRLAAEDTGPSELPRLVEDLPRPTRRGCPAHRDAHGRAIWRNEEKSYFLCPECGMVYLERFAADEESYSEAYFMAEYEKQYGKTYLEDFAHIARMGTSRLGRILSASRRKVRSVLDIGCAYGPFLSVVHDRGIEAFGADIATEAVEYVRNELGLAAVAGDIRELDLEQKLGRASFDAVTLWYVIEHFPDLDSVLARLRELVRPGGVLGLSTPHGAGISARRTPDRFYTQSPRDHFSVWTAESAGRLLGEYGFELRDVCVTGHHPERYPIVERVPVLRPLARLHSRIAGWGDTFELYAVRKEDP